MAALGFNFNGNEEEIVEYVMIREREEDESRKEKGLVKVEKRRKVKSVVLNLKLTLLFIQKSKLDVFDNRVVRGHRGKGFGGFMNFKVGFKKVDRKSLEPPKLKLASPSSPDVRFESKEKSQEGKVSVNLKHISPVLMPNWSSCLAIKGHVMKCRNFKNNFKLSLNLYE
ncbi:hypothetical protein LWI28_000114 [Acer negundo]|uniref:Uncharacterized protein n=1 Tax=Acer negundo TaxID=4023 RepID=A0AAD5JNS6_ACENE|nr:hypothetical protein LWI28_000114 [Acer negundo]